MALKTTHAEGSPERYIGVTFSMTDAATGKQAICRVTYEALCDRSQRDYKTDDDWMRVWMERRQQIEEIASINYDAGKPTVDGLVVVDTLELTPL